MSAQQDQDVATQVMGWNLRGNRWFEGDTDTGLRTATWKPSEDVILARRALKKWIGASRTARTEEPNSGQVSAVLFEENLQLIEGLPINIGLETKRATGTTLPETICLALLS